MANTIGVGPTDATGNDTTPTVTLVGTTITHGVVIGVGWNNNSALTGVDVGGQAATIVGSGYYNATLQSKIQFAYLPSLSSGGNKTITATIGTGTFWTIYGVTLAGADTGTFFDAENGATGNSTNPTVSLTTVGANASIFSFVSNQDSNAAPGTGYIRVPGGDGVSGGLLDFNSFEEGEYDLDAGAAGARAVDYTVGTGQWTIAAISLKTAGSPPPASPGYALQMVQNPLRW